MKHGVICDRCHAQLFAIGATAEECQAALRALVETHGWRARIVPLEHLMVPANRMDDAKLTALVGADAARETVGQVQDPVVHARKPIEPDLCGDCRKLEAS